MNPNNMLCFVSVVTRYYKLDMSPGRILRVSTVGGQPKLACLRIILNIGITVLKKNSMGSCRWFVLAYFDGWWGNWFLHNPYNHR